MPRQPERPRNDRPGWIREPRGGHHGCAREGRCLETPLDSIAGSPHDALARADGQRVARAAAWLRGALGVRGCAHLVNSRTPPASAKVLYRGVNERDLRQPPVLVTARTPLAPRGHVLPEGDLAKAILDDLLERGTHSEGRGRLSCTRHLEETERVDHTDASRCQGSGCDRILRKGAPD